MLNQLQKAINLAKITGDKIMVIDSLKPDSAFVVMRLEEYEKFVLGQNELRSLTEEELLDRINRDIAIWKSENDEKAQEKGEYPEEEKKISPYSYKDLMKKKEKEFDFDEDDEDMYYYKDPFSEMELEEVKENDYWPEEEMKKKRFGNHWEIPSAIKNSAEEVVEDVPF